METVFATAFVLAILMAMGFATLGAFAMFVMFCKRMHENSKLADLYRTGQLPSNQPAASGWTLTYKNGRKIETMVIQGDTEAQAAAAAMKANVPFDKIVSLTRN